MYAVVMTGGKQYRVEAGSELVMERLAADAGAPVTFDRVLLVGDGETVTIGTPTVEGATVSGTVLGEQLGPKLIIFKFKQKATYRRTRGHRQHLVRVRIDEINASGRRARAEKPEEPARAEKPAKAEKPTRTRRPAASKAADKADAAADAAADARPAPSRRSAAKKAESKE